MGFDILESFSKIRLNPGKLTTTDLNDHFEAV